MRNPHTMIRHLRRPVVAVCGATVLALGGGTVASAGVVPPTGTAPSGLTAQQAPARTTQSVPAPASSGSASVVNLEFLDTCISCTTAHAGAHAAHGRSAAVRLLGHDVAVGESASNAAHEGGLLELPVNPLLNLAIADWSTASGADAAGSFSHSRAALVDLALLGETPASSLLTLALLESTSDASYTDALSHGNAVDNGVDLTALHGALVIIVLHSETSSAQSGSSYVVSINGNRLVTSEQTAGSGGIPVAVPGVLTITFLQVSDTDACSAAGCALIGGSAAIGTLTTPGIAGETAGVVTAQSQSAPPVVPVAVAPATGVAGAAAVTATMPGTAAETAGVVTAQSQGAAPVVPAAVAPSTGVAAAAADITAAGTGGLRVPAAGINLGVGGLLLVVSGAAVATMALRRTPSAPVRARRTGLHR